MTLQLHARGARARALCGAGRVVMVIPERVTCRRCIERLAEQTKRTLSAPPVGDLIVDESHPWHEHDFAELELRAAALFFTRPRRRVDKQARLWSPAERRGSSRPPGRTR